MTMERRDRLFGRSGFTLLEVMVALAILAIGLVTVMQLFAGALRLSRVNRGLTKAVFIAQQVMDDLVLRVDLKDGYEDSGEEEGYSWTARAEKLVGEDMKPNNEKDIQTADFIEQIGADDAVVPVNIFKLTVTVTWRHGNNPNERHYELTTLKTLAFHEKAQ
ncbi:MAG: hypothetical protein DRH70_06740 [Candidatus Coatesbacteria bacterium]|nr:MAG: hypothetical protein DRH70_06740 [Candidatus Coatesbacteria bacterium]